MLGQEKAVNAELAKKVDGCKEILQEPPEKIDYRDEVITKAKAQIKNFEQQVAEAKRNHSSAQDEIRHLRREQEEEKGRKTQVIAPTKAHSSRGSLSRSAKASPKGSSSATQETQAATELSKLLE